MKPRTTGDVIERLQRLGLNVTVTMIADDTAAHYLPDRETAHLGRDGASGVWEPWMERRAERLYRLRALDRRTHRGPSGNVLRLLLFIADDWGWEHVRKTCIDGYRIFVRGSMRGATNRLRRKPLTLENLPWVAEEIAEEQYRPKEANQAQIDRVKMTIGLLKFGVAPDGRMGTVEPFLDELMPEIDANTMRAFKELAPFAWTMMSVGENEAIKVLNHQITDKVVQRALSQFRRYNWRVRVAFRKRFTGRENGRRFQTNPLTGFGFAAHYRFNESFRKMTVRATPAQMLGGQIAHSILQAHGEDQLDKLFEVFPKWLAIWLQSDDCAKWLERMEREVNQQKN
jgi:hypothetical protein